MRHILRNLLSGIALCLIALAPQDALAGDALTKYKLNLADPDVCTVYYMRAGNYQALEPLKVGVDGDGNDIMAEPYPRIKYAYDGKFIDCRGIESTNVGDYDGENFVGANQGFLVFDFGEKGIDLQKIVLYNDGYFKRHQQGTVFVAFAGPTADGPFTESCVEAKYQKAQYETNDTKLLRTNGSNQSFSSIVTNVNNWVTGTEDPSECEPGYYATTVKAGNHIKYRYVAVYDWSNYFYLSEVEIYGVLLKNSEYNDKQLDLERAISEAQAYATEFSMSDPDAISALNNTIAEAQALLDGNVTDEAQLTEAGNKLIAATEAFMGNITYKLGDDEFYCTITTASQENGLKLASEQTTVGNYTGYVLQSCLPDEAIPFSVSKSDIINGQQSYQLATADGVVIQTGSTLMLVDAKQVTSSNPAKFVFTKRYSDGEDALYDFKAGNYFYYLAEDGTLATTEDFPEYESFEEIIPYTFMLTPSSYQKTEEEAAVNFNGWEFNDAAKKVTDEFADKFGLNAGNIVEGWRLNKWRMYTRVGQTNGFLTISVDNPYYAVEDTLAQTPLVPAIDEQSALTSSNNGAGICRENGAYASQASRDPIDQVRDSTYLEIVNPIYCPYIAVKIAGTDEKVDLSGWSFSFFIQKGGIEPHLNLANAAGHKGDVYYWLLTDCGFTVGQVGYSAQYMGMNAAFQSTKQAVMIDWIRPYESIDAIPEESFTAAEKAAVVATLPENPVYEAPQYEVKKVEYLGQYIKAMNSSNGDLTDAYVDAIAQLTDGNLTENLTSGTSDVYFVLAVPEAIRKFQSLKVYYKGGNDYSTNVFFYTSDELDVAADNFANYVPNGGGLWQHTAFSGSVETDATNGVTTITNTNNESVAYIALRGDNGGNPLSATEIEFFYYDDGTFEDKPGEGQESKESIKVKYLADYMKAVNPENGDETATYTTQIAELTDGNTDAVLTNGRANVYYVIALPEGLKDFQSFKVFYNTADGGNEYATNVFFYTVDDLDVTKDAYGNYVFNGGALWQHTGFNGAVATDATERSVTFTNTAKEKFNYIAIKGDNGGNPLTATEIELYYLEGNFNEPERIDPVNYWALSTSWVSSRNGGTVTVADGTMTATAGTDNAKRCDIKNPTESFYLGDHKIVFYVAVPTEIFSGVTQNYGDMKFGYTTTVAAFSETAVVNEQHLRGNASNTEYTIGEEGYLVYFDLSARNANVAYYQGDSGNKFDGATKDTFRAALTEATDLTISNPNFTLIGSDATNFTITRMGSAKDLETLLAELNGEGDGIVDIEKASTSASGIFDLQGRRISKPAAAGVYIINGKKVFVK